MNTNTKHKTAEETLSHAALQTLSDMKVEEFVGHLRQRGISSLEDLAKVSIGAARVGIGGGIATLDPEDFPICYKFTVRPHVGLGRDLATVFDKVKNTQF
jgi:hypothetical protein